MNELRRDLDLAARLESRIETRTARVVVVGLGYVGGPLAEGFAAAGFPTVGVDRDPRRLEELGRKLPEVLPSLADAHDPDVVCLAVHTPSHPDGSPDLDHLGHALADLAKVVRPGTLVVMISTVPPGTTRTAAADLAGRTGLVLDEQLFVAHCPERMDPANARYHLRNTPRVVGGTGPVATALTAKLMATVVDEVHTLSSCEAAELSKLHENAFRAVGIALVNELARLCDGMGVDVWEVLDGAATKPYGFFRFLPGPGVGGECIAVDPRFLVWKAKELGVPAPLVATALAVNDGMPVFVAQRSARMLGGDLTGRRVLVIGVTYKADVADLRMSPALEVLRQLRARGAEVAYHDPLVPELTLDGEVLRSEALTDESVVAWDLVVVTTPHRSVDWQLVARGARRVLDTRAALRGVAVTGEIETL